MTTARLLLISPVRNEAAHIERVAEAVARQTRPPDRWIVVDDCSDDATPQLLRSLEQRIPFLTVLSAAPVAELGAGDDRLAAAAEVRAFNAGLRSVRWQDFTHIGKLDGDIEPSPRYCEQLLAEFDRDPALGLAGGRLLEPGRSGWALIRIPDTHVHGAVKLYSRACFEAIGGIQERLAWDTIDGIYARMAGFRVRSFPEIQARHHRPHGSAQGQLRGRARHGQCAYVARYGLWWVMLRSVKVAASPPVGLSGAAFLYGFLRAAARSTGRVEDEAFARFVRRDLRRRMARRLRPTTSAVRPG